MSAEQATQLAIVAANEASRDDLKAVFARRATVDLARPGGARALAGYPTLTQPGERIGWHEIHVGSRSTFAAAGFAEVSRTTLRRVVIASTSRSRHR